MPIGSNRSRAFVLVAAACVSVWAALVLVTINQNYIYSWDSAAYVETARSIHEGRGLMQRTIHGLEPSLWEPISWWPPGYPILVALVMAMGVSATTACVLVALVSSAISVCVLAWITLPRFHWALTLALVLVTVSMPPFIQSSSTCMSDAPYFLFAAASLACLISWAAREERSYLWLVIAGILAGAAWGMRYAGSSLFIATVIFFLCHVLWAHRLEVAKMGAAWLTGVALCAAPLMLWNLKTFGAIVPYSMPPSELSLWSNLRNAGRLIVLDMSTSRTLADLIIAKEVLALGALLSVTGLLIAVRYVSLATVRDTLKRNREYLLLATYAVAYLTIVIAARTKYLWGEQITSRHLFQIYWILWILLASCGSVLLHGRGLLRKGSTWILAFVLGALVLLQLRSTEAYFSSVWSPRGFDTAVGEVATEYLAKNVGKHQLVLSTRADLLRTHADLNARKIPSVTQYDILAPLTRDDILKLGASGLLWGLVIEDIRQAIAGEYDWLIKDIAEHPHRYPELEVVKIETPAMILKYRARR